MRARRGFTLIESLVAGGLFVVLGLIAYTIFKYAMIAHNRGIIGTDAQHSVRELVNRMSSDLQSSMALQISSIMAEAPVQSAVLYPSTEGQQAVDDLIFTAPAVQNLGTLDASNAANYLLVRYAVHLHDPTKANDPPTAVLRRAYRFDEVSTYVVYGTSETGVSSTNSHWYVNRAALDAAKGGPGDNTKLGTAANDTPWQEIITLTGQYDLVTFTVSHRSIANNNTPPYEPFTFTVAATVERYVGTPTNVVRAINPNDANDKQNDRVIKDLSTDVTLQRF